MFDWDEKPLGELADFVMGQSPTSSAVGERPEGFPFLQGCAEFGERTPSPRFYVNPPLKIAPKDSILISVRAPVGTLNLADQKYGIGRGLAAIVGPTTNGHFLRYAIELNTHWLHRRSQGSTFLAIGSDDLRKLPIRISREPSACQLAANVILALEAQIEATEALIAKQQRVRAGLLQDLFTRGVDEQGALRRPREEAPDCYFQTKVGWLPKAWEVSCLKHYAGEQANSFVNGPFGSDLLSSELRSEGVPVIYVRDIQDQRYRRVSTVCVENRKAAQLAFCSVRTGDVLIAKVGDPPCMAALYLDQNDAIVTQDVIRLRPAAHGDGIFILGLINSQSCKSLMQRIIVEGTRSRVSLTDLKGLLVPKPRLEERKRIGEIILALDKIAESFKLQHGILTNLKSALMQDLLTGRVSVAPLLESEPA